MAELADASWPDAGAGGVLLVPVGSIEQHGPHLPLDTDSAIAGAVARAVAARLEQVGQTAWVGPPLAYTSSGEHQSFPGTVSIGASVLGSVVVELVRSASSWATRTVLVNAHGGNAPALERAVAQLVSEGHAVSWLACRAEGVDLHAGRAETSLMLHLRPSAVDLDRAVSGDTRPLVDILPAMMAGGVAAVSPSGVLGDPAGASEAEGAGLVDTMADELFRALQAGEMQGDTR